MTRYTSWLTVNNAGDLFGRLSSLCAASPWPACRPAACAKTTAAAYDRLLRDLPEVVTPCVAPEAEPVYHVYVVPVPHRDWVQKALQAQGIATGSHYPISLYQQPVYAPLGHGPGDFPFTASPAPNILSLSPLPDIAGEQIEMVASMLRAARRAPAVAWMLRPAVERALWFGLGCARAH